MNVLIENYRGVSIEFDNEKELFICSIDNDYGKGSKSYASIKKYIDDYIKENNQFEPFFIVKALGYNKSSTPIKVIGIRKDLRFITENSKGQKEQLSDFQEDAYLLYNKDVHDTYFAKLAYLETLVDDARKEVKKHEESLVGDKLIDVKSKYIPK